MLLYHYDCPGCAEAIPLYDEFSRQLQGGEDAIRFALIEIPPYGPPEKSLVPADTNCLKGRIDESKELIIQTPVVVVIWEGVLIKKWEDGYAPNLDEIFEAMSGGK